MDMYYQPLLWACSIVFLTSAPLALVLHARRPRRIPWLPAVPFEFAALYASFLFCAGLSHHVLRFFRLEAAWCPFVVMFVIKFLLYLVPWALIEIGALVGPDLPPQIPESAEWAALFGALFTAFWWIVMKGTGGIAPTGAAVVASESERG